MRWCVMAGLAALMTVATACGPGNARAVMDDVDTYAREAPDSARKVLEAIPERQLWWPGTRARHALQLSMALDRCGVPVQSDSIIRPAVNYYRRVGGPVNRFLSCYYLGRVHENRGDKQSAMEAFVKADAIRSPKVPLKNRCALQIHEGAIYAAIYDYDRVIEASTRAAGIPMVLDADALNLMAAHPELLDRIPAGSILTPHKGEFRRLVGGLLARGYPARDAAALGVWLHGHAGDVLTASRTAEAFSSADLIDPLSCGFHFLYREG